MNPENPNSRSVCSTAAGIVLRTNHHQAARLGVVGELRGEKPVRRGTVQIANRKRKEQSALDDPFSHPLSHARQHGVVPDLGRCRRIAFAVAVTLSADVPEVVPVRVGVEGIGGDEASQPGLEELAVRLENLEARRGDELAERTGRLGHAGDCPWLRRDALLFGRRLDRIDPEENRQFQQRPFDRAQIVPEV